MIDKILGTLIVKYIKEKERIHKNAFVCLFSVRNIISLSRQEEAY